MRTHFMESPQGRGGDLSRFANGERTPSLAESLCLIKPVQPVQSGFRCPISMSTIPQKLMSGSLRSIHDAIRALRGEGPVREHHRGTHLHNPEPHLRRAGPKVRGCVKKTLFLRQESFSQLHYYIHKTSFFSANCPTRQSE